MATHTVTAETIDSSVQDNGIVILDFWASWCDPCLAFAPVFEEAAEHHEDVFFGKIDTQAEQALAMKLQIRSIPTLMVFRDQILVYREPGALPKAAFEDLIKQVKELDMNDVRAKIEAAEKAQAAEG